MDWSRTKTIFIVVFSILNVFLIALYTNQYQAGDNLQVAGITPSRI
ncbi:regulatory protein YycI of two-component signal transduction system YycFG [Sporosarcina luteola]|nr:regulatory protein YycI of two-component signal transduction system YycFG [Sporosarcina luteola]